MNEALTPEEIQPGSLRRFHIIKNNKPINTIDQNILDDIKEKEHIYFIGGIPYIYNSRVFSADESYANLAKLISRRICKDLIDSNRLRRIINLFKLDPDLQASFSDFNKAPPEWICYKNGLYNPISHKLLDHSPDYKLLNQIPWEYHPEENPPGSNIDEWLTFSFPDSTLRELYLQYVGLTCTRDTRQQRFLMFKGPGGTGKSIAIRLIESIVGEDNASHISLHDLEQRFAAYGLFGKLLNSCADLEIHALDDSATIKKLLGEDTMRGEAKGKDAFSFRNYARLVFSANEIPIVKGERTNGLYRRLLILPMEQIPQQVDPNLFDRLYQEIPHLLHLSMDALSRLYESGQIIVPQASKDAARQLRFDSDTTEAFIEECCHIDPNAKADRTGIYNEYSSYCIKNDRQSLSRTAFYKALRDKGYKDKKSDGTYSFTGIGLGQKPQETTHNSSLKTALGAGFVQVDEPLPFL